MLTETETLEYVICETFEPQSFPKLGTDPFQHRQSRSAHDVHS